MQSLFYTLLQLIASCQPVSPLLPLPSMIATASAARPTLVAPSRRLLVQGLRNRQLHEAAAARAPGPALCATAPCHASSSSANVSKPGAVRKPPGNRAFQPAPLSSPAPAHSTKPYSKSTVSIVRTLARLLGYNRLGSAAIRVTSDMYDRCAEAAELQRDFWYQDASLPASYQTWFHITHLHVWLLLARFRALPNEQAAGAYAQEIINHFFIDAESRMREKFGVQTARLVKGYMRDMHTQQRGALIGLDQGIATTDSDVHLAQALWRNLWGAGGFEGDVGGVKRKVKGIDKTEKGEDPSEEGPAEMRLDQRLDAASRRNALADRHPELAYPQQLERATAYVRREVQRLANISDADIMAGRIGPASPTSKGSPIFGSV